MEEFITSTTEVEANIAEVEASIANWELYLGKIEVHITKMETSSEEATNEKLEADITEMKTMNAQEKAYIQEHRVLVAELKDKTQGLIELAKMDKPMILRLVAKVLKKIRESSIFVSKK